VEPTEIQVDELMIRPWRPSDAEAATPAFQDPVLPFRSSNRPGPYTRVAR
jgi:hypothetical protein